MFAITFYLANFAVSERTISTIGSNSEITFVMVDQAVNLMVSVNITICSKLFQFTLPVRLLSTFYYDTCNS